MCVRVLVCVCVCVCMRDMGDLVGGVCNPFYLVSFDVLLSALIKSNKGLKVYPYECILFCMWVCLFGFM